MKIKCIAIDDEPPALYIINEYVTRLPFLQLEGLFSSPVEAMTFLNKQEVELIFMDIQMPELSGIELIKTLSQKSDVIFTTSYPDYALQSYELNAVDYLLKPISFERFVKAVNKLVKKKSQETAENKFNYASDKVTDSDYIFVKTDYKSVKIYLCDILYIEGLKEYVIFHLKDERIISLITMKNIEEQLLVSEFVRVHRSFIVAVGQINFIERNRIFINNQWIPIGQTYRSKFEEIINMKKLE
jgi:two-component system LytT family response regulator